MSGRGYYPYTGCDIDPQEHARWVLSLTGADASDILDDRYHRDDSNNSDDSDDSNDSNDSGVKHLFRRLPENWRRMNLNLKYIRQKSGGGCGSGKRFVPVSCSKDCPNCHGCSPGCGRNYEFEEIDYFFLDSETLKSLRNLFDENPEKNYIYYRYCVLYRI
jgi:hypothetical protein